MNEISVTEYRNDLVRKMQACGLPRTCWEGILEFIVTGRPMGSFLTALFSNDLILAVTKADDLNIQRLRDYAQFLQACAPAACHGSAAAVRDWGVRGGLIGITQEVKVVVPDRLPDASVE